MKACGFNFDNSYLNLPEVLYTSGRPSSVPKPALVILNEDLANSLELDFSELNKKELAALFSGNRLLPGAQPFSQAYAGHQFGHFTMLGDGRAHIWGEHLTADNKRLDIQFKGSGRTPYSRSGDGRAALGPMLREYIISEAMHALGIPTTRSLAVVTTGDDVIRETLLPGAILTRVARSHIRVGTFEFAAGQGDNALLKALLDYTVNRHDTEIRGDKNVALAFLQVVMERQADLLVHWMRVGFIHGVMNTDNMTISGETIDYGPCAFMDEYDPHTVFSAIDYKGRYAYANQPEIAQWNLARLAETLLPLIHKDVNTSIDLAKETIARFTDIYHDKWLAMMRAKLGLLGRQPGDKQLILDLLSWMQSNHADYTNTFYDLTHVSSLSNLTDKCYTQKYFEAWFSRWQARLADNNKPLEVSVDLMQKFNPAVIPRNHRVERALATASEGDVKPLLNLLAALKTPYTDHASLKPYQAPATSAERVHQTFCGT